MASPDLIPEKISTNSHDDECFNSSRFSLTHNREISVDGIVLLSDVPTNITLSSFSSVPHSPDNDTPPSESLLNSVQSNAKNGAFLGLSVNNPLDRILNPIGKFRNKKFLSIFRFKTWWSTMWIGSNGSDLQMETQLIVLQVTEINSYVLILPLIENSFRSAFHPGANEEVVLCVESGSTKVKANSFSSCVYFHVHDNPYDLMRDAFAAVRVHLGTFRLLAEKAPPKIVDKFGWCTWDAFYLTIDPVAVWYGIKGFAENGLPPRFLIIDDGWQSINLDHENPFQDSKELKILGSQMVCRLYQFEENEKFAKYQAGTMLGSDAPEFDHEKYDKLYAGMIGLVKENGEETKDEDSIFHKSNGIECLADQKVEQKGGLKALISDLKRKFSSLDDVYMWHALCGAWGGIRPETNHLNCKVIPAKLAPGLEKSMPDLAVDLIVEAGIGLVEPSQAEELYETMHSYLADAGVTGVKVDVIHTLEYVCEDNGGRVELAKAYYDGLTKSLNKNFDGTGLIASMEQCNDFFFLGTKQISMGRVGDDFWFQDPNGDPMGIYWLQGVHMIHCSYNSLWQGQFIQPDWDMFQSHHLCAEFHAGSRAICGGPVFVSDKVGKQNFDLLRKLVLPDGTILRCQHYALPTRDCLFENPLFDGKTLLKIWNLNKFGGVVGVFNCQGAGWCPKEQRSKAYPECYKTMSGFISPADVEWEQKDFTAKFRKNKHFAVYLHKAGILHLKKACDEINITLQPSSFEIFTISPVYEFNDKAKFAAVGLENMFNSGGAVEFLDHNISENDLNVVIQIKGSGKFLAYSTIKPEQIVLNDKSIEFEWKSDGMLKFEVPWTGGDLAEAHILISI